MKLRVAGKNKQGKLIMARTKKSNEKQRKIIRTVVGKAKESGTQRPKSSSKKLQASQAKSYAKGKARDAKAKAANTPIDPALTKAIDAAVKRALAAKKKRQVAGKKKIVSADAAKQRAKKTPIDPGLRKRKPKVDSRQRNVKISATARAGRPSGRRPSKPEKKYKYN
tara:strand:+ start:313 stop:813 length:501 start_codon:yes stop_codon:yes gene_type:complete